MKKIFILFTIACMALTGCTDDLLSSKKGGYAPAKPGDEVLFGGSMTYSPAKSAAKQTRTVYGDKLDKMTELKWLVGDKVRIYCDQAYTDATNPADVKYCDYSVSEADAFSGKGTDLYDGQNDTKYEYCSLKTIGDAGLRWGEADIDGHYFFGVYPSPAQFGDDDVEASRALKIEAGNAEGTIGKLTAYLPSIQYPSQFVEKDNANNIYVMHPAMRYAYMVAAAKASPSDGGVDMLFMPVVTAVEMVIVNNGGEEGKTIEGIDMITISSPGDEPVAGDFTTTIKMGEGGITDIDNCINSYAESATEKYNSVSVPIYHKVTVDDKETAVPVDLAVGESIKFTVFLLLDEDASMNSLNVAVRAAGVTKQATLDGKEIEIVQAKKKNFIHGVGMSIKAEQQKFDYSKWMGSLAQVVDPNTKISPLSVPGAGGAWSGTKNSSNQYSVDNTYRQQDLSFGELWDCGIRCFEMQVDDNFNLHCNTKSIKDEDGTAITFEEAMNDVIEKVNNTTDAAGNPTEFAFVIVTYSNTDGVDDRNSGSYQSSLSSKINTLNSNNKNIIIPWQKTTTIDDAKGHVFVISRPGSIGVDYGWHGLGTANSNILSILGWGSMPDQWYARGFGKLENYYEDCYNKTGAIGIYYYTLKSNALTIYDKNTIEENTAYRPFSVNGNDFTYVYNKDRSNFGYYATTNTERYGGLRSSKTNDVWDNHNAWVQEWKRVVLEDFEITNTNDAGDKKEYSYYWKSNIDEKWDDVEECLTKSMNDADRKEYAYYINSLCGYFVTNKEALSYQPALNVQRYGVEKTLALADGSIEKLVYCDGKYQGDVTVSAAGGSLTNMNISVGNWGPYSPNAGLAGDVETFASWINGKFWEYLNNNSLAGKPTGIVLLDRVSNNADDVVGLEITRAIIQNNFYGLNTTDNASAMRVSLVGEDDGESYDPTTDILCAPEKR